MAGDHARSALQRTRFGDVRWFDRTASTNSDALDLARNGEREGVVLVADHQTAGRGRAGRTWEAPAGSSLLMSVLLRPPAHVAGLVTAALAVATAEALDEVAGIGAGLKWPNDLVVGDRKLAGILAEADWPPASDIAGGYRTPGGNDRVVVIAGMGLNVNWPADLPDELADVAVAANHLAGRDLDREELLVAILHRLDHWYGRLVAGGRAELLDEWRRRSVTLGRRVRIDLGRDDVEGTAVDVDDDGHLLVDTLEGVRRTFAVGDVVHLRPADDPSA